jgi:hypothetical protein
MGNCSTTQGQDGGFQVSGQLLSDFDVGYTRQVEITAVLVYVCSLYTLYALFLCSYCMRNLLVVRKQRPLSLSTSLGAGKRQGREVPGSPSGKGTRRNDSSVSPQQVDLAMVGDTDPAAAAAQGGFSEQALQQWKVRARERAFQSRVLAVCI